MAKAKHRKTRPAQQTHRRKRGKETDISELRAYLDALGLKIIQVTADGNCFFRALADQLEGNEDEHEKYRNMVVRFIKNNREMFEPFIEDEVPFDEYCVSIGQEGNWAGHMELQAASLVTHSNICIHRHMSTRWYTQNFDIIEARMIHLSYHDGEHYNSVRSKDDSCSGPARPIVIKGDADLSAKSNQEKVFCTTPIQEGEENFDESTKTVNMGSGVKESAKTERDERQDMNCEHHKLKVEDETHKNDLSDNDEEGVNGKNILHANEKKILKTKACPCGSDKKHKSCSGSVSRKSSARFPVNQTVDYMKGRKDRKQGRKGPSAVANSVQSNGGPPDLGALCI